MNFVERTLSENRTSNIYSTIGAGDMPNVLNPDDVLMQRFQKTLGEHLTRVIDRISGQIVDLVSGLRVAEDYRVQLR